MPQPIEPTDPKPLLPPPSAFRRRKGQVLGVLGSLVAIGGVPFWVIAEEEAAWGPGLASLAAVAVGTRLVVAGARKIDSSR